MYGLNAVQVVTVCLLILLTIPPTNGVRIWECSGKPTTYTYTDCETDKSLTDGCYYLVHFEQYRPCNSICDGVEMWSIDEERCSYLCPEYLRDTCVLYDPTLQGTTERSTRQPSTSSILLASTIQSIQDKTMMLVLVLSAVAIALGAFGVFIAISIQLVKIFHRRQKLYLEVETKDKIIPIQATDKDEFVMISENLPQPNIQDVAKEALMKPSAKEGYIVCAQDGENFV